MATRNLARTIIEGGRHFDAKRNRKERVRKVRRMRFDSEGNVIGREPTLTIECVYHFDRLKPLTRWLRSNVGRPWTQVYREICALADGRTEKGWHMRDHVRSDVDHRWPWAPRDFYVDAHGFLRHRQTPRTRYRWTHLTRQRQAAFDWAAGRRVVVSGSVLFWTAEAVVVPGAASPRFSRQGSRLTPREAEYWSRLSDSTRHELTYRPAAFPISAPPPSSRAARATP
jgi:hypothetical protein